MSNELQLSAEMDRTGHVTLTVALTEGTPRVWTAIYDIVLESGQLEALSRAAQAFESAILNKA